MITRLDAITKRLTRLIDEEGQVRSGLAERVATEDAPLLLAVAEAVVTVCNLCQETRHPCVSSCQFLAVSMATEPLLEEVKS